MGISGLTRLQDSIGDLDCDAISILEMVTRLIRDDELTEKWRIFESLYVGEDVINGNNYSEEVRHAAKSQSEEIDTTQFEIFAEQITEAIWNPKDLLVYKYDDYDSITAAAKNKQSSRVLSLKSNYGQAVFMVDFLGEKYSINKKGHGNWVSSGHSISINVHRLEKIIFMDPNFGEVDVGYQRQELNNFIGQWLALMGLYGRLYNECRIIYFSKLKEPTSELDSSMRSAAWVAKALS